VARENLKSCQVLGTDISPSFIKKCNLNLPKYDPLGSVVSFNSDDILSSSYRLKAPFDIVNISFGITEKTLFDFIERNEEQLDNSWVLCPVYKKGSAE
jgi:hypothetical protein